MTKNGKNEKKQTPVKEQTIEELWFRLNLVKSALRLLRHDPDMKDDPRQPSAIKVYQGQAKELRDEIQYRKKEPVKIKLKTAKLTKRINT